MFFIKDDYLKIENWLKSRAVKDSDFKVVNSIYGTSDDNYLVICDLLGGSPYKQAALLSCEHKNIRVVTGANVGGILDVSLKLNKLTIDELAKRVVEASLKNLQLVNLENDNKQEEVTDGI